MPRTISRPYAAQFDGHCSGCNLPITEGQAIRTVTTGAGAREYVHDGHEEDDERLW